VQKFLPALGLSLALAAPAAAFDPENMTDAERTAFGEEVRAYLLDNPEVLMEAIGVLEQRQAEAEAEMAVMAVADNAEALFASEFDWTTGNPDGDVVVVEFIDYRCGFCRRAHPEVNALVEQDGNIRLVIKELPILGEDSLLSSQFAIATRIAHGDEGYEAIHNGLIEMRGDVSEASLISLANEAGLDPEPILAAIDDPIVAATIESNHALAQRLGISGTPSFVFGDQLIRGYVPLDGMQEIVAVLRETAE